MAISKTELENMNMELEKYVDKYGLKLIIETLSEIAHDKSVHIAESWQDVPLAKLWTKRGNLLAQVSSKFAENSSYEDMKDVIVDYHTKEEGE